jgi:hypothetical protein
MANRYFFLDLNWFVSVIGNKICFVLNLTFNMLGSWLKVK